MKDYVIYTDTCADFDEKMIAELGIEVSPLTFHIDGGSYANWPDGREMAFSEFYSRLRGGSYLFI